ncbi:MAG: sugar phosphate isomerase/epimerase [Oscillospiraceae bacterium]|jgi:sugar phosphate isomerase/epimerase|nr:sugar phosphate isomerase/epimerase [Oscillospiraceae bacterium]
MEIGAQLYTVRDLMQTPEDQQKTLTRIADMGYRTIQVSGFPYDPARLKDLCDALGLRIVVTHTPAERILHDTAAVIADHQRMDCPYVGVGSLPGERTVAGARAFLREFRPAMEAFAAAGLKFQYHNHSFEFQRFPEGDLWSILVQESDPALLGFILDTYWVHHGGKHVPTVIRSLRGRIDLCHVKDLAIDGGAQRFAAVGSGNFDWPPVLAAFGEIGTKYAFVEQDDCYGADPLEELAASYRFLTRGSAA